MLQNPFTIAGFEKYQKKTRREQFLVDIDNIVPWRELVEVIEHHYPNMHRTHKGNEWHFGMKMQIGVNSMTKQVHSIATSSANMHDSQMIGEPLHGQETRVRGDSTYTGQPEAILNKTPYAQDCTHKKGFGNRQLTKEQKRRNTTKSKAKTVHIYLVSKCVFGFEKVRTKGLRKIPPTSTPIWALYTST